MLLIFAATIEIAILWWLSQRVTKLFFLLCLMITRSRTIGVTMVTLLTFPGTVVHELSHMFIAEIMGVHTGKLTLVPEQIDTTDVRAGSVMISQTDPFRRALIGTAPLFVGMSILIALTYWLAQQFPSPLMAITSGNWWVTIWIYLTLVVSTTMFPSAVDLKGIWGPVILLLLIMTAVFFTSFRIALNPTAVDILTKFTTNLVQSLGLTLSIHVGIFLALSAIISLARGGLANWHSR